MNSESELDRHKRIAQVAIGHAIDFKKLYHEKQDECEALEDIVRMMNKLMLKQGAIIRKLEIRLGIDQEL